MMMNRNRQRFIIAIDEELMDTDISGYENISTLVTIAKVLFKFIL